MKKRCLAAVVLCLAALFTLTACGGCNSEPPVSLGTTWSKTQPVTYTYSLSHSQTEGTSRCGYEYEFLSGTYTTTLTPIPPAENGTSSIQYRYTTELRVSGNYVDGEGNVTAAEDVTTTETVLHEINTYSLFPIENTKTLRQTGVVQEGTDYVLKTYEYRLHSAYDFSGKSVTATIYGKNAETGEFDAEIPGVRPSQTHKKLSPGKYFENDAMLFTLRAFPIAPSYYANFNTLDVINDRMTELYFSVGSGEEFVRRYTVNGEDVDYEVLSATLSINTTMSGASIELYFMKSEGEIRNIVTEVVTVMPYGLGTLTYSLCGIS